MKKSPHDVYRACAASVVLRKGDDGVCHVLLVHKPRKRDDWQLPQGGVEDGETTEQAALRELSEEAGIEATAFGSADRSYQYDFPPSYRRFRPDNVCGQCIHFIYALAEDDAEVEVDEDEIDGFIWALPEELPRYLKRKKYLKLVEQLVGEAVQRLAEVQ